MTTRSSSRLLLCSLLGLVAGALDWAAWLSWGFDDDHAYSVAQVVGCGVCAVAVVIALAVAFRWLPIVVAPLSVAIGLTVAWTVWAAAGDDSGLFGVGAVMMLVGTSVALTVVAGLTRAVLARR